LANCNRGLVAQGWHSQRAVVNSRLAKRVGTGPYHACCVRITHFPPSQAPQTQRISRWACWHRQCCILWQPATGL